MGHAVFQRVRHWFQLDARSHPLRAALARALGYPPDPGQETHPFDHRHRVDTSGLFYADDLATGHQRDAQSAGYYATAPSLFRAALQLWAASLPLTGHSLSDYSLLDLGCGKGRALMLATESPFRRITGVELHPGLARIARRNLHRWMRRRRACPRVEILNDDALSVPFPAGPLLIFFFNSFERGMIEPFLDRLLVEAAARPQPIDVIYIHPEFGALFRRRPGIHVLADLDVPLSPEDAAADVFGVATDRVAIYRLASPLPPPPPPRAA